MNNCNLYLNHCLSSPVYPSGYEVLGCFVFELLLALILEQISSMRSTSMLPYFYILESFEFFYKLISVISFILILMFFFISFEDSRCRILNILNFKESSVYAVFRAFPTEAFLKKPVFKPNIMRLFMSHKKEKICYVFPFPHWQTGIQIIMIPEISDFFIIKPVNCESNAYLYQSIA